SAGTSHARGESVVGRGAFARRGDLWRYDRRGLSARAGATARGGRCVRCTTQTEAMMTEPHSRSHGPDGRRLTSRRRGSSSGKLPTWNEFSRGPLPFLGVAFAGFAMAYLVIAIFVFPGGSGEEEVEIPNVVGLPYDEAVQRLGSYGFATDRAEERYDASAPAYTVIEQTPRAGITDVAGATIRLAVSRGQLRGEVPMVMGLTREEAAAVLEDAGLEVGDVSSREDSAPRGQVVGTAPSIGSSVPLPSAVNLVISTGPSRVEIPDVT